MVVLTCLRSEVGVSQWGSYVCAYGLLLDLRTEYEFHLRALQNKAIIPFHPHLCVCVAYKHLLLELEYLIYCAESLRMTEVKGSLNI